MTLTAGYFSLVNIDQRLFLLQDGETAVLFPTYSMCIFVHGFKKILRSLYHCAVGESR